MFDAERERAYKDTFVENLEQSLTAPACTGAVFTLPAWADTAWVVIPLTGREITRLVSCIEYGADLLYPDAANEIYYSFVKGLECSMLCDAILEQCLSSPEFAVAISAAMSNAGVLNGTGASTPTAANVGQVLYSLGEGCTDAERYGICYGIVDILNQASVDFLDVVATITDEVDFAVELARAIPLVGQFVATGLQIAAFLIDHCISLYLAAYNTTSHEAIACAIYCEVGDSCDITLEHVMNGYSAILTDIAITPPGIIVDWVTLATWYAGIVSAVDDNGVVAVLHYLILNVFARGSAFQTSTVRLLAIALGNAGEITPPETCECEPELWTRIYDFTIDEQGWNGDTFPADTWGASYVAGVGWENSGTGGQYHLRIQRALGSCHITSFRVYWAILASTTDLAHMTGLNTAHTLNSGWPNQSFKDVASGTLIETDFTHDGGTYDLWTVNINNQTGAGLYRVTKVILNGDGTPPTPS